MAVEDAEVTRASFAGRRRSHGVGVDPTLLRFLAVGGISYVVNQTLLFGLYEGGLRSLTSVSTAAGNLDIGLLVGSVVALEASILVRFGLNDRWTFRGCREKPFWRRLTESNLSALGGPLIALTAVNGLTPVLGISYLVANSIGIAVGLVWNWLWSSKVVWRRASTGGVEEEQAWRA